MSKYLLDTHIFLWSLLDPTCLKTELAQELEDPANQLWLSPITTWEVIVLCEKGRIRLNEPPAIWLRHVLDVLPFREATLNHEVAIQSRRIRLFHQDPADRFIAASAMVYGLILMTADRALIDGAGEYAVLSNY